MGTTDQEGVEFDNSSGRSSVAPAQRGKFTIFAFVDALTRLGAQEQNAGDRTEADARASTLLALAA
jgi:hypothetical protein